MTVLRKSYPMPGGTMSALHFNADKGPVRLVFAHANGFNALTYRAVLEPLDVHTVAIDLRGHGMTDLPTDAASLKSFQIFADDIATFIGRYVHGKVVLSGHSFGAVSAILASGQLKDKLSGYAGFDPVTLPWMSQKWPYMPGGQTLMKKYFPIAKNAGNRRSVFDSLQAAFERYKGRGGFKHVSDEILQDYLTGGLKPHDDGVQLTCHPLWEQAVFVAQGHDIYKAAGNLPENSRIVYAGGKAAVSTPRTRAKIGRVIGKNKVLLEKDFSHLFPIQKPAFVTDCLDLAVKRSG